jgi:glutamyl-tRNA synthetase
MVQLFDLADVNRAASIFSTEKLDWLNQHYIKNREPAQIARCLGWQLERLGVDPNDGPDLVDVVMLQCERAKTLSQMAADSTFYYQDFDDYEEKAAAKHLKPGILAPLADLGDRLAQLTSWTAGLIHEVIVEVAEQNGLKMGKLAQPLRVAVSGRSFSPPIDLTLELVGRERSVARINRALRYIEGRGEGA